MKKQKSEFLKKMTNNFITYLGNEIKNKRTKEVIKNVIVIPFVYVIYKELKPLLYCIFILIIVLLSIIISLIYYKLIF
jgi:hypothetical protein